MKTRIQGLLLLLLLYTQKTVRCQQQRFRVRPANASVVEGDTAVLRCEVHHQVGQLQWAKDGFALGFSRSLPGYSRYGMLGDPGSGVHDLEIRNVTLEDDGHFQCQVSPNRGQAAIKGDAFLTVLAPPSSVSISSAAAAVSANVFEVEENTQLTLSCDVTGARPAAVVQWQRNGENLDAESTSSVSDWGSPLRHDTTSVVTLRPTAADDGAGFSCVAKHPAIRPEAQRRLNSTVTLSVLHPPDSPEIQGYTSGEALRIGEQRKLVCTSAGGNPPAELIWLRNGQTLPSHYYLEESTAVAELVFNATASDWNATYRCEAKSKVLPESASAAVRINVQYSPQARTIPSEALVSPGENVTLKCKVDANPIDESMISWRRNGIDLVSPRVKFSFSNGTSYLSLENVTLNDTGKFWCEVNNGVGSTSSGATVLVRRAPRTVATYKFSKIATGVGSDIRLRCLARAIPKVTISWKNNGVVIDETGDGYKHETDLTQIDLETWQSILRISDVQDSDYGHYECLARNGEGADRTRVKLVHLGPPDPPSNLEVFNVNATSVTLNWHPGFDGGAEQNFRVRCRVASDSDVIKDVPPDSNSSLTVTSLKPSVEYSFAVVALNRLGASQYSPEVIVTTDTGDPETAGLLLTNKRNLPWVVIVVFSFVGGLLLLINTCLIVFFIRRRAAQTKHRLAKSAAISQLNNKPRSTTPCEETDNYVSSKNETDFSQQDSDFHKYHDALSLDQQLEHKHHEEYGCDLYAETIGSNSHSYIGGAGTLLKGRPRQRAGELRHPPSPPTGLAAPDLVPWGESGALAGPPQHRPPSRAAPGGGSPSEELHCGSIPPKNPAHSPLSAQCPVQKQSVYNPALVSPYGTVSHDPQNGDYSPTEKYLPAVYSGRELSVRESPTPLPDGCVFAVPSAPRSAAIKHLPTFGSLASLPPQEDES